MPTKTNRRTRIGLESLEDRRVMSGITASLSGGVLSVVGTNGNDTIWFRQTASSIEVDDTYTNQPVSIGGRTSVAVNAVNRITVDAKGGNDKIVLRYTNAVVTKPAQILDGDGNDTIYGGDGGNRIIVGKGTDTVYGGSGTDYLEAGSARSTLQGYGNVTYKEPLVVTQPLAGAPFWGDIQQLSSPTCAFDASLAAVTRTRTDLISRIKNTGPNQYTVQLYDGNGRPVNVPVTFDGTWTNNDPQPLSYQQNNVRYGMSWAILYQRAYLNLMNVDTSNPDVYKWYSRTGKNWQNAGTALAALTGRSAPDHPTTSINYQTLGARLAQKSTDMVAGTIGSKAGSKKVVDDSNGVIGGHYYTVIGIARRSDGHYWLTLRNPWGHDTDNNWLAAKKAKGYVYHDGMNDDPSDGLIALRDDVFQRDFSTCNYT